MTEPSGKIVARPMVTRACGCKQEFQHYSVDKYRAQRLAKFQKTRCTECVAKLNEEQRLAAAAVPKKGEALQSLPAGTQISITRQADGNLKVAFSELGRPPAYSGKTELTLAPGERRVLRLPIITQPDNRGNLETVAVIWTPALGKDQNGHSRFEVH